MKPWQSFKIAFSLYSKIPIPKTEWTREAMQYAFCFLPLVGIPMGLLLVLWCWASAWLALTPLLFAAVATVLPVVITGGIHLDGFCDTVDALSSRQTRERKLEILKDPHTGAFAILGCAVYFLLTFGLWAQLSLSVSTAVILGMGFVLSRSLSGFAAVRLRPAKPDGLLKTFSDSAHKRTVAITTGLFSVACFCAVGMVDWRFLPGYLLAGGLVFLYYRVMSYRQFGGVTGDLAGYFLQLCELALLASVVVTQIVGKGIGV